MVDWFVGWLVGWLIGWLAGSVALPTWFALICLLCSCASSTLLILLDLLGSRGVHACLPDLGLIRFALTENHELFELEGNPL